MQQEIVHLERTLTGLQQLVAELLLENERLRRSFKFQSDDDAAYSGAGACW